MVIAIEPMINMGPRHIRQLKDGWTVMALDKKPSAHFEHTIAITDSIPDILSSFQEIENAIKKNNNITEVISTIN
jgi:methionyl aminopeptidase